MPTTSPDSIYYADGTTPASLATITAAMATSVQNALNVREGKTYSWANATERNAQTGMAIGQTGYQVDNDTFYIYNGAAWKIWAKEVTAYTPTFTNLTATSTNFNYSISSGIVRISGSVTNSTTTSAGIRMSLPTGYNIDTALVNVSTSQFISNLGNCTAYDDSGTEEYPGFVSAYSATAVWFSRIQSGTGNTTLASIGGSQPFGGPWASSDIISTVFTYPVA